MDARELINRYLFAVGEDLPDGRRDDIVAELSDSLQSQVEDREAGLGRSLTVDEAAALLREYGPPAVAAGRYAQARSLVGSLLFPFYTQTLRVTLCVALGLFLLALAIGVVATGTDPLVAFGQFWGVAVGGFFAVVGIVTIVFALIERFGGSDALVRAWNPRSLRPVGDGRWFPRSSSIFELVFNGFVAMWLLNVPYVRSIGANYFLGGASLPPGQHPFAIAPVFNAGVLIYLATVLINVVLAVVLLVRPDWTRLRAGVLAVSYGVLAITAFVLTPVRPLVLSTPNRQHLDYAYALHLANDIVGWSLLAVGVVALIGAVCYARRFVRLGGHETNGALTVQSTAAR